MSIEEQGRPSRRGRPSKAEALERENVLINHALNCFMTRGYRATTMDGLASAVGASKSTIYRRYGSKALLLRAAMERSVPRIARALSDVATDPARQVEEVMRDFAVVVEKFRFDPEMRAMWRAISEARDDLGTLLDDAAEQEREALSPIADYLSNRAAEGRIVVDDPHSAASSFAELIGGGLTAFIAPPPAQDQRRRACASALRLFLRGIAPD